MHSDESECDRLRTAWRLEGELKEAKVEEPKLKVTSSWLEDRISRELMTLDEQRESAAKQERSRIQSRILESNEILRKQIGERFIKNAQVEIADGQATFVFRGESYVVTQDYASRAFLLNDQPVQGSAGDLGEKLIFTLTQLEDRKRTV